MTYKPMHSAQAQSAKVTEKIFFICWSPLSRHYKGSECRCILYPYFRVKSLRFELHS